MLGEPEDPELGQCGIERILADTASPEELPSVIHHGGYVRRQVGKLFPVSQGIDNVVSQTGAPSCQDVDCSP